MEVSDPACTAAPTPTHRRWIGVLLSLLLPGAGIFLGGDRKAGLAWFFGLTALSMAAVALAPLPAIPGLGSFLAVASAVVVLTLWMLVRSYRPIPKLGIRGWFWFVVVAFLLGTSEGLIPHQFARAFKVPTGSMEPTILPGDRLFVQDSAYWFGAPTRGDVVVFRTDPLESSLVPKGQFYVKRIAALPGDAVRITGGRLLVNERPLQSPAVLTTTNFGMNLNAFPSGSTDAYLVPAGSYFVVGDNVTNSLDSRHYGAVPRQSIVGRATKIYWPWARSGDIR
jgi:signal peptidase I